VAGDLGLLPGCQARVDVLERLGRLGLEPADLLADGGRAVGRFERAKLLDLGLDLGDRLFEVRQLRIGLKSGCNGRPPLTGKGSAQGGVKSRTCCNAKPPAGPPGRLQLSSRYEDNR
jgi:hypothetical protein